MDTGKHFRELESVSMYDTIRMKWAERVTGISNVDEQTTGLIEQEASGPPKTTQSCTMGSTLKKSRQDRA